MPIAVLLSNPDTALVTDAVVRSAAQSLEGWDVSWLADGVAAQFDCPVDANITQLKADLDQDGIDLNLVPNTNRKKQVLLADMDSTMIGQECIDELAAEAGVGDEVADITARAMNGELDFEDALRARVKLLKGLDTAVIDTVWTNRITLTAGGKTLVSTMKRDGAYAALVSGGFTDFTKRVAKTLGFQEHRANTLLTKDTALTGNVKRPILGRDAKVTALEDIIEKKGLTAKDVLAVGDGANDLGMLDRAGMGVALHAKPTVQAQAAITINHGDLTALLYLQGYHQSEFVT